MKLELDKLSKITFAPDINVNVADEVLMTQVAHNIRLGLPQLKPYLPNKDTVAVVCGGPSLNETKKELVEAVWQGAKIVALNNSYNWCLEQNLKPSAMIMLDAREFNTRFVERPVLGCKYLLASQCHPKAFEICKNREVFLWHACSGGEPEFEMLKKFYWGYFYTVGDGTTVGIRAMPLLRMLGYERFILFGFDSCYLDGDHHAYDQMENDIDARIPVWLCPKDREDLSQHFICAPWHVKQAEDFLKLIKEKGNIFRLDVRGRGLIAAIMRIAAQLGAEEIKLVQPLQAKPAEFPDSDHGKQLTQSGV